MLRKSIGLFVAVCLVVGPSVAQADEYPNRPIKFVQGFAPGGNADVLSRIVGEEMQPALGQPMVYESKAGAAGIVASEMVARSEPDGYTIVLLTTAHAISAALNRTLKYDPVKDFSFISMVTRIPFFLVVNSESRFQTIADVVQAARAKPDAITYGTAGLGSGQHLTGELFSVAIGAKLLHVPFRGDSGAVAAILSKSVDVVIAPGTALFGNISGGNLRAIAVSGRERWAELGSVPTVAETVAPGFEMLGWIGVAMPKGAPKPIVDRLNKEVRRAVALTSVQKRIRDTGNIPYSSTPEQMTELVASDIARFNGVIDKAGIERH